LLYNNIVIDQEVISINKQGKTGAKGDTGPQGKTRRIFKYTEGHLKINFQYYCNSIIQDYYIDDNPENESKKIYRCIENVKYNELPNSLPDSFWELVPHSEALSVDDLLAEYAYIKDLYANSITIKDSTDKTYAEFKAPNGNEKPLWLGGSSDNPNFSVDQDGNLTCNNVKSFFKGSVVTGE